MSNEMNNLFAAENNVSTTNGRSLSGTAQLTNIASSMANEIIQAMNNNIELYADDIKKSQVDNSAMDSIIERLGTMEEVDLDFLRDLDEATIDGMLKSQQSKRSRCKSKAMTMDNYRNLMTGAIAENLIRLATGKEKHAGGPRRAAGAVNYTIEQLQMLEADQEKLRKEIRNIQSKKSIMKSKADFDESDERWQALLKAEQQLKDMRIGTVSEIIEVDSTKNALNEILAGRDLTHIKAADSKELLEQIAALVGTSTQEETEEVEAE